MSRQRVCLRIATMLAMAFMILNLALSRIIKANLFEMLVGLKKILSLFVVVVVVARSMSRLSMLFR
jgi:hypothetical protein